MSNFYFTFGHGHHDTHGRSLLGYYVKIEAKDNITARGIMFDRFGEKWAFCYNEDNFSKQLQDERFSLEELYIEGVDLCCGVEQSEYLKLKAELAR